MPLGPHDETTLFAVVHLIYGSQDSQHRTRVRIHDRLPHVQDVGFGLNSPRARNDASVGSFPTEIL